MTQGKKTPREVVAMLRRIYARTRSKSEAARQAGISRPTAQKYLRDKDNPRRKIA